MLDVLGTALLYYTASSYEISYELIQKLLDRALRGYCPDKQKVREKERIRDFAGVGKSHITHKTH